MKILLLITLLLLQGCASVIDEVVRDYYSVYDQIKIGDSKEEVIRLLEPSQNKLKLVHKKPEMRYTENGQLYDVYFARSGRIPDGQSTDDEFTPYIFKNGKLVEIGWKFLGGPKRTYADVAREMAEIHKARAGATKVEVKNEQNIEQHIHKK